MSLNRLESIKKNEIEQAKNFALVFELEKEELEVIDHWVETWMDLNIKKKKFTTAYDSLQHIKSRLDGSPLKYLLGRLIKIHDLMWGGVYSVVNFSSLEIRHFIDEAFSSKQVFSQNEFTSLLAYLRGTPVNPNSDIFDYIWKIEKQSKFFYTADLFMRNKALHYLLELNSVRGYHHNIKDFKRILGHIKPDNTEIINLLNHYKVRNNQGCYQAISFIFDNFKNSTFEAKKDCIIWLDNAVGGSPKQPWLDKLAAIQRELPEEDLMKITHWILNNEHLEREESTGWLDDIYKKFQKSSKWYLALK